MVAGVFGRQVGDGGGDTGGEQQHALSEVTMVELTEHLLVPVSTPKTHVGQWNHNQFDYLVKMRQGIPVRQCDQYALNVSQDVLCVPNMYLEY